MFYYDTIKLSDNKTAKVLKSSLLDKAEHFFTTRDFILNCGNLNEYKQEAETNRELLCRYFNIPNSKLFIPKQTHSDHIKIITEGNNNLDDTDSVISDIENTAILLNFADCTPVIIYSAKHKVGAVVHAGWRGCAQSILPKTVRMLYEKFSVKPKELTCVIGPSIGSCCYCVNEDVYYKIKNTVHSESELLFGKIEDNSQDNKYYVDLKRVNQTQLEEISVENIDVCNICTSCQNDLYFSYRKEKGITARHSAILKI